MNDQISVVTSCSVKGWHEYGRAFFESFLPRWPPEVALHIVSEDLLPLEMLIGATRCKIWDLWAADPTALAFDERHREDRRAQGRERRQGDRGWTPNKIAHGYNFRYDALRFARKVFAIDVAARAVDGGRLFWVDADVVTHAPVPRELLERLLPDDATLCCLAREGTHSECGFVGYNLERGGREFIAAFAELYASGWVFDLAEWHDSWVFDWLREKRQVKTAAIPHCSRRQPFANSELGRYMDHRKGASKECGRTPLRHLVVNRDLPYWGER